MIYVVLCDTARLNTELCSPLVSLYGVGQMIDGASSRTRRRTAAYLALGEIYELLAREEGRPEKFPPISRDLVGKPYFTTAGVSFPCFSISYDNDTVCIALSDTDTDVGVDIERKRECREKEKIEKRLTVEIDESLSFLDGNEVKYFLAVQGEGGRIERLDRVPNEILRRVNGQKRSTGEDFFFRWTLTEAILKADGGGFFSVESREKIKKGMRVEAVSFKYLSDDVYLSVAIKNR